MRLKIFTTLLILFYISSCSHQDKQNPSTSGSTGVANMIALSDIHFDPLFDCPKTGDCQLFQELNNSNDGTAWDDIFKNTSSNVDSHYGQDTNYALLQYIFFNKSHNISSIATENQVAFAIVVGDFVGHGLKKHYMALNNNSDKGYSIFVKKLYQFLTYKLKNSLGKNIVIYPVIGNNDSYIDDYNVDSPYSTFYKETADTWNTLYSNIQNSDFTKLGYYTAYIPQINANIISLNSNLFSLNAVSSTKDNIDTEAKEELDWLNTQLQNAKTNGQKVILTFHIPSAIDSYASATTKSAVYLWKSDYQAPFLTIINQYKDEIVGIFNSHTHSDSLYVDTTDSTGQVQLFSNLIASISPQHSNNPSFKVIHFTTENNNLILKDIDSYYFDLNNPTSDIALEYNFNNTYGVNNVANGVKKLFSTSLNDNYFESYFKYYNVNTNYVLDANKKYYFCGVKYVLASDYNNCLSFPASEM